MNSDDNHVLYYTNLIHYTRKHKHLHVHTNTNSQPETGTAEVNKTKQKLGEHIIAMLYREQTSKNLNITEQKQTFNM